MSSPLAAEAVMERIAAIAASLREAHEARIPIPPISTAIGVSDVEAAYAIQEINTRSRLAQGGRLVGRKIGLTSRSVQQQLGVDQPDYGMLFSDMLVDNGATIGAMRLIQPRVEVEAALVLERDLAAEEISVADMIHAVAYCLPALEIVDSRIRNWEIKLTDTIADNASAGLFVLGETPVKLTDIDLRLAGAVLERDAEIVSLGVGAACLGSPLLAAAWLARTMVRVGRPLKAGDVVMTGALGPMVSARPGDAFDAMIGGLGRVRVRFESGPAHAAQALAA